MGKTLVIIGVFVLLIFNASAAHIRCENKAYAGTTLVFYRLDDPVTGKKSIAFSLPVNANGKGEVNFELNKAGYFFSDFGIYRGMLLLLPNENITLKLPPFKEKSFVEEKNPYFQPIGFWFVSENGDCLNDQVSAFDQTLNQLIDKHFNELYLQQSKAALDSIQQTLNAMVPPQASAALLTHKKLKLQLTEADAFRRAPEAYATIFNEISTDMWQTPAFTELLNKSFDNQLSFMAQAIKGDNVRTAVANQNLETLRTVVEKQFKVSGSACDLILLKLLHDAFYSNEFSKDAIQNLVGNPYFTTNKNLQIKTAAVNISQKFSFLTQGSTAPIICLKNLSGEKICSDAQPNKFKYLVFADIETAVCREQLKYLSRINELFSKHLAVYVILRNTQTDVAKTFFAENDIDAEIAIDANNKYIDLYKIRSFPQCFLLNEQHQVVFEYAKAPLDGFEEQFGNWLRNELFMRQRNQSR